MGALEAPVTEAFLADLGQYKGYVGVLFFGSVGSYLVKGAEWIHKGSGFESVHTEGPRIGLENTGSRARAGAGVLGQPAVDYNKLGHRGVRDDFCWFSS